ncbi:MAG: amidase [Rhodobacterales bacterium]|nr:MAG: amidase [Rhodobacterales bacterium]
MEEWLWMEASALGRQIGSGEIDPVALCDTYLAAIDRHPDASRIYTRTTPKRARAEAEAARIRARNGQRRSALDGVPVSWKDLFDSAGTATEAGTALMAGRVPQQDAEVLRRATAAGLVCLGKTHLSEIAFSGLGLNPITQTPPHRTDPGAVPGGSSSGAAASVAQGLAAAAVGSDTGGSVRIPAAWNDLVGLKTTHGLLPLTGVVPLAERFDTVGPLTRSVADAALMLGALGGPAPDLAGASLKGARFAILETIAMGDLESEPASAFASACARLEEEGAVFTRIAAPELEDGFALAGPLYTADAWAEWGPRIEQNPDAMWPPIHERVHAGADVSASDYLRAWRKLERLRARWAERVAGYDAVLCPTAPIRAPQVARLLEDSAYYVSANLLALRNTRIGNLMGGCGVSLPTGVDGCGILLNGLAGQDARLLRVAAAAERVLGPLR